MPEALIFDYDGVLADTEVLHWRSWAAVLRRYDFELSWEEYCMVGRGVDDAQFCNAIGKMAPGRDCRTLLDQNVERKRVVSQWAQAEIPIPRETLELLATLNSHVLGLVTTSERDEVEPVLRRAKVYDRFTGMVFGSDVAALKPAPDPYLLIAHKLAANGGIVFEDSAAGVESAFTAGFRVIRVAHPKDLAEAVTKYLRGERDPDFVPGTDFR